MNHTPGPWRQHTDGEKTYASVRGRNGQCVADCGSRSDVVAQANAKLIAASPDLLEALMDVFKTAEDGGKISDINWTLLRVAVAKATGEGP
jgi:hypothetical protein